MATRDSMYEKGYNMAFYLYRDSPHILDRAMNGHFKDMPEDFLLGLKHGRRGARTEEKKRMKAEERERKKKYDIEYRQYQSDEKAKDEALEERLKRKDRDRKERGKNFDEELIRDYKTDHVQKRLRELDGIRDRDGMERDKKHRPIKTESREQQSIKKTAHEISDADPERIMQDNTKDREQQREISEERTGTVERVEELEAMREQGEEKEQSMGTGRAD